MGLDGMFLSFCLTYIIYNMLVIQLHAHHDGCAIAQMLRSKRLVQTLSMVVLLLSAPTSETSCSSMVRVVDLNSIDPGLSPCLELK